jgi:hypothetical protein
MQQGPIQRIEGGTPYPGRGSRQKAFNLDYHRSVQPGRGACRNYGECPFSELQPPQMDCR